MATLNFDASTVDPTPQYKALPSGWYTARIVDTVQQPAKNNPANEYIKVTLEVLDGPQPGAKIFTNINIQNSNPVAQEIAYKTLSQICHAVKIIKLQDTTQLHGIPMAVKLMFKPEKDGYNESNDVKEYRPYGEAPSAAPTAAPTGAVGGLVPTAAPDWARPAAPAQGQQFQPQPAYAPVQPVPPQAPFVQQPAPVAQSVFPTFQQAPQANPHVPQVPLAQTAPIQPAPVQQVAPVQQMAPVAPVQPAGAQDPNLLPPWDRPKV